MPLKLVPPRPGKTPYYYVRGSYLGIALDRSTKSTEERLAKAIRKRWREQIERGEYQPKGIPAGAAAAGPLTFLAAAVAYMKAGGERKHLGPIIEMTGPSALRDKPIADVDQIAIDTAAAELYPKGTSATRNRQFYTPVLAVLHHGGIDRRFKRPKGWRGTKSTSWLEPAQAFRLFREADKIDAEFGLFLRVLCYTGMRLGDALGVKLGQVNLERQMIYLPRTKNNEPRAVYLPKPVIDALKHQPPRPERGADIKAPRRGQLGRSRDGAGVSFLERDPVARLFRFHASGYLRELLKQTMKASRLSFPRRQGGFHIFCHTYGTWMHRFGELDTFGLTRTGRWADERSADRYRHSEVSEESRRADRLPSDAATRGKSVEKTIRKG